VNATLPRICVSSTRASRSSKRNRPDSNCRSRCEAADLQALWVAGERRLDTGKTQQRIEGYGFKPQARRHVGRSQDERFERGAQRVMLQLQSSCRERGRSGQQSQVEIADAQRHGPAERHGFGHTAQFGGRRMPVQPLDLAGAAGEIAQFRVELFDRSQGAAAMRSSV
jgi:hypothetical protein